MSISSHLNLSGDCVQTTTMPVLCLRLETPRERLALPYASLVAVELSANEATLILNFVTHRIVVRGRKLHEAHCAVAAGLAAALVPGVARDSMHFPKAETERMAIREIGIHPMETPT